MFFKMYDWVYKLKLPINEHKLLPVIMSFTEYKGQAHLSYSVIEEMVCINRGAIKKTIDNLIEWGLIEKISPSVYKSLYLEIPPKDFKLNKGKNNNFTSSNIVTSSNIGTSSNIDTGNSSNIDTTTSSNIDTETSSNIDTQIDIDTLKEYSIDIKKKNTLVEPSETFLPLEGEVPASYFESGMKKRPYDFVLQEDWDRWDITNKAALLRGEFGDIKEAYEWINENNVKR